MAHGLGQTLEEESSCLLWSLVDYLGGIECHLEITQWQDSQEVQSFSDDRLKTINSFVSYYGNVLNSVSGTLCALMRMEDTKDFVASSSLNTGRYDCGPTL